MSVQRPSPARAARATAALLLACAAIGLSGGAASAQQVPQTQQGQRSRAGTLFEQGELAAARTEVDAALRRNEADADALYYRGRLALQDERTGEAVDWFERAIKVNDRNSDYHLWLGAALGEETQHASKFRQPFLAERVRAEMERAVELDPRNGVARYGLVQVYGLLPGFLGGSIEKARAQALELEKLSPVNGHVALGFLASREKNTAEAVREYERAIAVAPDSTTGYLALAGLYQRDAKWPEAFATIDRLLQRHPDEPAALYQVGRLAALSGQNLTRGEQTLTRWLAHPPKDAQPRVLASAHHRLGQIYEKQGRRDVARKEYESALRINPTNDDARKSLAALG